jgi:transcription-repair coupling factor (superfamily II helicase)
MAQAELTAAPEQLLKGLSERLYRQQGFAEVVASLQAGHGATLDGVWGSSCALVAAALADASPATLVVVCPHQADVDTFRDDLSLFTTRRSESFPAWELSASDRQLHDELFGDRLRLLKSLTRGSEMPRLVVASIQSLLQPVPARQTLVEHTRRLQVGDPLEIEPFLKWLVENGFQNTTAVALPGEFSRRGGIVDIFAPDWFDPVRIELFGDEIESIRSFEISTQRSLGTLEAADVTVLDPSVEAREHFCNYLPERSWFLLVEPNELQEEGKRHLHRVERPQDYFNVNATLKQIFRFPSVTAEAVSSGSLETTCHLKIESVERFSGDLTKVRHELDTAAIGQDVFIVCQNQAECKRLEEVFQQSQLAAEGRLHFPIGQLHAGFRLVPDRVVLVSGGELFHRSDLARPSKRRLGRVIDSFLELREGDYVVHVAHGIGRYRGLRLLENVDQADEHLEIEFHGGTKIYVPSSRIELVQKYVGGQKTRPMLAKLGGKSWARQKALAERAVMDLASDMLEVQAARAAHSGITFPADTEWQKEFDAAFPYRETPDQLSAIAAAKSDMCQPRPMDRLICGDVGYGKTEVAMRAAFKAVDAGYQVAVLVPTTVLAEQHRRTFTARMAEFPFEIAALSRFCTRREQTRILKGAAEGSIDVVIGTHRLVQADVKFQNLGLIIIDEEQRFGVQVKERLKALKQTVDVLTLTATPIPRTLHMSLLGLRDISNLETPPEDRLAVETRVTRFDAELVRHAVLRELNRNGQIFFVHNRIQDIEVVARRLRQIVPEASLEIGHGQMAEGELEEVMLRFVDHKFDILLATTIVESGLDIPNANTIFIDQADRYGLADLHQLRGRVGRYKHRAYCYLLIDPNQSLSSSSARRLKAIEEFSDVGAGFSIAMRDLEIRGAGNILGTEQSGHIAAVGYELYCDLLEQAVRRLKNMPPKLALDVNIQLPGEAYLPRRYVPDMRLKIDLYRRLARVSSQTELDDVSSELVDRFGPHPPVVERLLRQIELRLLAQLWQIDSIHREDEFAVYGYRSREHIERLARLRKGRLRVVDQRTAYQPLPKTLGERDIDALYGEIKSLLLPA